MIFLIVLPATLCLFTDFLSRKRFVVVNLMDDFVDFDVEIIFNSTDLINGGYMQDNCFDILFTDESNGNIDFWFEQGCNRSSTKVWVKIPDFRNGSNEIRMYFGSKKTLKSSEGLSWKNRFGVISTSPSCGEGFSPWIGMENKFPLGSVTENDNVTFGNNQHFHDTIDKVLVTGQWVAGPGCDGIRSCVSLTGTICELLHTHTITLKRVTSSASSIPKHKALRFCYADSNDRLDFLISPDTVVMFDKDISLLSLPFIAEPDFNSNQYYVRGANSTTTGFIKASGEHSHEMDFTGAIWDGETCNRQNALSGGIYYHWKTDHHEIGTFSTDPAEILPPYYHLNFQRPTEPTYFTDEVITFQYCGNVTCEDPPLGWVRYSKLDNYFPIGTSDFENLTNSDSSTHRHTTPQYQTLGSIDHDYVEITDPTTYTVCMPDHYHQIASDTVPDCQVEDGRPVFGKVRFIQRKSTYETLVKEIGTDYGCFGVDRNEVDGHVCSGHGNCLNYTDCNCTNNYFGEDCENHFCYGFLNNDTENVCSNHGDCVGFDNCECEPFFNSTDCGEWYCNNIEKSFNETVCNFGKGNCVSHDTCCCDNNYFGQFCDIYICNSVFSNDTEYVCSGHGECVDYNNCNCSGDYNGDFCQDWKCFSIPNTEINDVCFGHGNCYQKEECNCFSGYFSSSPPNGVCDLWKCNNIWKNDSIHVCSGRGSCTLSNKCECNDDYSGDYCEAFRCDFIFEDDRNNVCSGNGECIEPEICDCEDGFTGEYCENDVVFISLLATISVIFSSIFCTFFIIIISFIILFVICSFFVCLICFLLLGCSLCFLCLIVLKQRKKVGKFSKLKNIDILMKEQEMEEDTSIAHIEVNRSLFEVDYEEIKIQKILGEGGSNSIVYLSTWKGSKIAFKCFKTRMLCETQNSFDEFEREVKIMSSVNHPNIVQFLGATLNPPRVGILMEFCENGELLCFFEKYKEENDNRRYSILEKIRMMFEIASSFDYLHSRSIIHRDLKSENVLLDSNERTKLMDFGLSRMVDRMSQAKTTRIGTAVYMAPEIINNENYDEKCDVFSFAILMYNMISENDKPYGSDPSYSFGVELKVSNDPTFRPDIQKLRNEIKYHFVDLNLYSSETSGLEDWICDVVQKCWIAEPEKRYGFNELTEMFENRRIKSSFMESTKISKIKEKENELLLIESSENSRKDEENKNEEKEMRIVDLEEEIRELKERKNETSEIVSQLISGLGDDSEKLKKVLVGFFNIKQEE